MLPALTPEVQSYLAVVCFVRTNWSCIHHDLNMEINKSTCGNREILRFAPEHRLFFTIKVDLDSVLSAMPR